MRGVDVVSRAGAWSLSLLVLTGLSLPAVAQSSSATNVAPSVPAEELARIEVERERLFSRMMEDPSNLDVAFQYAALSADAGDLEAAISTLERMLIFAPGLPRLQLELGVLYFRLGAYDTARAYFDAAVERPDTPEAVRLRVLPFREAVEDRTRTEDFSGAVLFGGRYQSNANAAPSGRTVNLNGVDFLLSDAATRSSDVNGFVSATLNYTRDLPGQGDRFEVNLQTYGALYDEQDDLNTILAEVTAGPVFDLERWRIEDTYLGVYGILGGIMLEADPYLLSAGVGTSLAKAFSPSTRGLVRAEYRSDDFRDSDLRPTSSNRTGDRYSLFGSLDHELTDTWSVFATASAERRNADEDYLSLWEGGLTVGVTHLIPSPFSFTEQPWALTLSGGYLRRDYDEPDVIIDRFEAEDDDEFLTQAALAVPINDDWSLQSVVGYRDVSSNYDLRTFSNVSASIGLMRRF